MGDCRCSSGQLPEFNLARPLRPGPLTPAQVASLGLIYRARETSDQLVVPIASRNCAGEEVVRPLELEAKKDLPVARRDILDLEADRILPDPRDPSAPNGAATIDSIAKWDLELPGALENGVDLGRLRKSSPVQAAKALV